MVLISVKFLKNYSNNKIFFVVFFKLLIINILLFQITSITIFNLFTVFKTNKIYFILICFRNFDKFKYYTQLNIFIYFILFNNLLKVFFVNN